MNIGVCIEPKPLEVKVSLVKICGNPDKSRWNNLDPSGCSLAGQPRVS